MTLTQASVAGGRRLLLLLLPGPQVLGGAVEVGHGRRRQASPGIAVCGKVEEAELREMG